MVPSVALAALAENALLVEMPEADTGDRRIHDEALAGLALDGRQRERQRATIIGDEGQSDRGDVGPSTVVSQAVADSLKTLAECPRSGQRQRVQVERVAHQDTVAARTAV